MNRSILGMADRTKVKLLILIKGVGLYWQGDNFDICDVSRTYFSPFRINFI